VISADALAVVRHVTALFFGVLYVVLGVSMIVGAAEMLPPGFWIIGMLLGPAFIALSLIAFWLGGRRNWRILNDELFVDEARRTAAFGFYLIVLVLVPLYFVVLAVNDGAVKPTFAATIPLFGVGIPLLYFCVLDFLGRR
jgi:hypothetical protein